MMNMNASGLLFFFLAICLTSTVEGQSHRVNSMQCDRKLTYTRTTPCTSCAVSNTVRCPEGWIKESQILGEKRCSYTVKLDENTLLLSGCSRTCKKTIEEKRCCDGYWGSECYECPGGSNPCNGHGICLDGLRGNGTCTCEENYAGYACQDCRDANRFGPNCQYVCECQHGICNSGVLGDGSCTCYAHFTGPKCDQELSHCGGVVCDTNSHCVMKNQQARCECLPGYKKIGNTCQAQDPCRPSPCSSFAVCNPVGLTEYECTCKEGYDGNGRTCQPINACLENNGGCPENSTICRFLTPGKSMCLCRSGMVGSPSQSGCSPSKHQCRMHGCESSSHCEVDADGTVSCVCKDGEIGDGRSCYTTVLHEISRLNSRGNLNMKLRAAKRIFELGCSLLLEKYGPFTVFVPYLHYDRLDINAAVAENLCKMYIIPGQHLLEDLRKTKVLWTLSGHQVTFGDQLASRSFKFSDDPQNAFITQSNLPASNGIIHIVGNLRGGTTLEDLGNSQKTIGEIIASLEIASRFETILENCGLPSILDGPGPFTVFVPSNEAVEKLRDGRLIYLFTEGISKLQELVKHHIYTSAAVRVERLMMMPHILTMANQILTVHVGEDGRIFLGDSEVAINKRNILASNGIIHTLDGIFIPPSIIPILPHRCSEQQYKVVAGSCVDCDALNTSFCPLQSTVVEHGTYPGECVYIHDPSGLNIMKRGCNRHCNQTIMTPGCCKGFFGPACTPCPGGFTNPCYGRGNCTDGILGNGQCRCFERFKGIACHICSNPNKHGENCDEDCGCIHGICDNRPGSRGVCQTGSCKAGYTGEFCDQISQNCGPVGASLNCHQNAVCHLNDTARCICLDGYEGDGFSCQPIDVCLKPERGGCSENAMCNSTGPGLATCQCNKGWTGDGEACIAIDQCRMETRGNCHINADCNYIGPGQSSCVCKEGYDGDGYNCDPVDLCLMNNGDCHELAVCQSLGGKKTCRCSEGYIGDGITCYGDIIMELARNHQFSAFFEWIKQSLPSIPREGNVTVLVPLKAAIQNLSKAEEDFWLKPNMLPFLVRAHFLQGSFTTEQLKECVGQQLSTLNPRARWEIKSSSGTITIQNASIVLGDIPAINSTIYIIDKVLLPPLDVIPPIHPRLEQQLSMTPSFSRFRELLEQYQLIGEIESSEQYTIFVPGNSSIEEYYQASNITQLDDSTVRYHVILGEKLFPKDLISGVHKSTMLGFSYWLIFYKNTTQAYVNQILLNGEFFETRNGMLIGVSQVLQIQKNRCTTNTTTVIKSRCAKCNRRIKCPKGSVLAETPGKGNRPHCIYKSGNLKLVGCYFTCVKVSLVSVCCQGYYGNMCEMCPGKPGNWCSGNGVCQDGIDGSGECQCHEGYHGTACEMCQAGRYGANCTSECSCKNGICNDGLLGNGNCECNPGWKGANCDKEIGIDFCNGTCHVEANCISGSNISQPSCLCSAGYTGNGTHCTEIDPCAVGNGGCSTYANCTKKAPGQRICTCKKGYTGDGAICREIDGCLDNHGGCHKNAVCVKIGLGLASCVCLPPFSGDGIKECELYDPCKKDNGGCSPLALCIGSSSGSRVCLCVTGVGDGYTCKRSIWEELSEKDAASTFFHYVQAHNVIEIKGSGSYTVFVPHVNSLQNDTSTYLEWRKKGLIKDLLRYHMVSCLSLQSDDLESLDSITALSGHTIRISVKEDSVYLNEEAKIIESAIVLNGVIHFIDKVLVPYDLQNRNISSSLSEKSITEVAKAYGYNIYSKLLVEAGLLPLVNETIHQPLTMLWPTDAAFNSLPENMQKWLYHKEHRSKLAAYLKGHMIRDMQVTASKLTELGGSVRTLHGSTISFSCSKTSAGDILVDNGNAKVVQRYMEFNVGIAYGIDQLLEPPDLGSRCDEFRNVEVLNADCGRCGFEPPCPLGSNESGAKQNCVYLEHGPSRNPWYDSFDRRLSWPQQSRMGSRWSYYGPIMVPSEGCKRTCLSTKWIPECCSNHYGRDCQVCPGGLEAPCSNRGTCNDGFRGSGQCNCSTAFFGTACEHCTPGRYGPECKECSCTEKGICNEGLHGDGFCFCSEGWTGKRCEIPLVAKCSPACDPNAVCRINNTCECRLHFEGDGRTCKEIDPCGEDNGGCSEHANCTQAGTDAFCSCFSDYQGDGYICSPIDRCADGNNGDCSEHAICISTGPNARRCECKGGYTGNGVQCLEEAVPPTDRCLEENGQCHLEAICTDLHFHDKTMGVFHLQSPKGKYNFTYQDAKAACAAEGATLATLQQLSAAQQMGFHLCIVGWLYNRTAGYPTVYPSGKCGTNHVGIVNYGFQNDLSKKWDAYCYRAKDVKCDCRDGFIGDGYTCIGSLVTVLGQKENFSIYYSMVLDYANATQEGWEFLDFLSSDTIYKTLFVPLNSGFGHNTSLTLNDLKLHVSVSDVVLLSFNLTAGTVIPSQAGYNLSIADSMNNTQVHGSKVINNTMIVEWDILASNGVIHAIETPLKVPLRHLDQVTGAVKSSASMIISVSTVVIVLLCIAIAGVSFYYLKRRNQGFQFQYFKAELEDDEPASWEERSPHFVSIPNPIYGADSSMYDPFEDSLHGGDFSDSHGILGD
ncbi:stabilin-1 [Hemicordylus capensis]|uniref:stabilin-1 n=1 Tax=Hemicordylus capensis TaxID=884348 RepID=UPI0023021D35|nr:stabilin-1 [Hemicordylus capensis]